MECLCIADRSIISYILKNSLALSDKFEGMHILGLSNSILSI